LELLKEFSITVDEPEINAVQYENPLDWFAKNYRGWEGGLLLHGGAENSQGRFSVAATKPAFILSVSNDEARFRSAGKETIFSAAPLDVLAGLDEFMKKNRAQKQLGFFGGGLVCLVSYEMNRYYERVKNAKPRSCPDVWCGFYPRVRVFDSAKQEALEVFWKTVAESEPEGGTEIPLAFSVSRFECDEPKSAYLEKIMRVRRYIEEGDVYQVNLSRRLSAEFGGNPLAFYRVLAEKNSASYGAFLNGGDFHLLSLSPELFFSVDNRRIKTSPIKGTAPRSTDISADSLLRQKLVESEKNRAENLMIVDLMRSDLGRICKPGTVAVESLFQPETLPYAHQLVSTISGELFPDSGFAKILSSLWPGGSVTGAPKIRAMEIISEMETTARGAYCGSLVAWGMDGSMKASLLIRTMFLKDGMATYRTGGGITVDSDPEDEFEETVTKASMLENVVSSV
jgi:para-aminobenzoate synthetase component 1